MRWLLLILVLYSLSSCSRYYYKPNGVNAPLLAGAHELHLSANATTDAAFTNVQAAYSPVNHLGILAGISTYAYKANDPDAASGNVNASAHLAEVGAGYYYATTGPTRIICDVYGGAGGGSLKSDVNMHCFRSFIQPGIGLRTHYFELSLANRVSAIKYYDLNTNGHDDYYLQQQHLLYGNRRIDNTTYLFYEPSVTLRGGYKFIMLQLQYVSATALSNVPWAYNNTQINLGIHFQLEEAIKAIKKPKQQEHP